MKFQKNLTLILIIILTSFIAVSCTEQREVSKQKEQELYSQKSLKEGKIPITVLVKYAFSINAFEKAAEERFPNLDIIQVGNYTYDRGLVEYERRLQHDDLTDMVMTWPLEVGEEYWEDRLIDLSGMEFTSQYHLSMLDKISRNGKLYYLPGPAQVRGIVYNKTLFEENGWEVPNNFDEFVALCQTIEESGMRSIQLGFKNPEVLDAAFTGYSFGDCYNSPKDAQWLEQYNNGVGSIGEQLLPALETFEYMKDAGIWKEEDLNISYSDRETMLFTRKCAMTEDSVLLARMGHAQTGSEDEFALMPFFTKGDGDAWARLYMVCYIGLNKHLQEKENKEKYDLVLELMKYISTPEGQEALSADTGAMYSSVKGVEPPNIKEIELLKDVLKQGRYAIFPELKNAQPELRECLAELLKGTMTMDEVIAMVDRQNKEPIKDNLNEEILCEATSDFSLTETGNFLTDAMKKKAGTDIALFMNNGMDGTYNGKGVSGKIYEGYQTKEDASRILPDLKHGEKGVLQKVIMTGEGLIYTLEYSIPVDNNKVGWFYYFSGLKMEYDPVAEPGSRIKKITDTAGNDIDPKKEYTIAAMDGTLPEENILSVEDFDISISDLLMNEMKEQKEISPSQDNRFIIPMHK